MASQYWGSTPNSPGTQTLYSQNNTNLGQGFAPQYNSNPSTGYPNGPGLMNPVSGLAMAGPYGGASSMTSGGVGWGANGQPRTNVGGYWYMANSPEAYAAQQALNIKNAANAGTATGTFQQSDINAVPAISGLLNASTGALGSLAGAAGGIGGTASTGTGGAGGIGGGTGYTGGGGGSISGGAYVPSITPIDTTQANAAAYAKAKDQVGQTSRSSINSTNAELAAQGLAGGGAQTQAIRDVITAGQGELGDVTRGLAQTQAGQNLDIAKTNQGAAITQRGQDIAAQQAQAQLALEQRQQNFQLLNTILNGLRSFGGGGGLTGGTGALTGGVGALTSNTGALV